MHGGDLHSGRLHAENIAVRFTGRVITPPTAAVMAEDIRAVMFIPSGEWNTAAQGFKVLIAAEEVLRGSQYRVGKDEGLGPEFRASTILAESLYND